MGNMELLCMQCRGIGPHLTAKGKSPGFSQVAAGTCCIFSSFNGDGHLKLMFVQLHEDSCLVMRDTSGISTRLGRTTRTLLNVRRKTECNCLVSTVIFLIRINFQQESGIVTFEVLNSTCLMRCQRDTSPPLQTRRRTRAFSRVFTGDSDTLSPCEMKDEPAFKKLQGNPTFFSVRASQYPFQLRQ